MLGQRQLRMRRGQAVAAGDPVFRRQVFQIDPHRLARPADHGGQITVRQRAAEGLDHHVGGVGCRKVLRRPVADVDAVQLLLRQCRLQAGGDAGKAGQIVHPQAHREAVLVRQLPRQAPGDADVAVVVDHGAENVPALRHAALLTMAAQHSAAGAGDKALRPTLHTRLAASHASAAAYTCSSRKRRSHGLITSKYSRYSASLIAL